MAKRSIEETFQAVKPKGRKGIPSPPTIAVGAASDNSDLSTSLSQAGQQIAQLQSAYQQQASLITPNTQAVEGNTSAQGTIGGSAVGGVASSLFGGPGVAFAVDFGDCEFVRGKFESGGAARLYASFGGGDQRDFEFGDARLRPRISGMRVRRGQRPPQLPARPRRHRSP